MVITWRSHDFALESKAKSFRSQDNAMCLVELEWRGVLRTLKPGETVNGDR